MCVCVATGSQRLLHFAIHPSYQWTEQDVKGKKYKAFYVKTHAHGYMAVLTASLCFLILN